MRKITLIFMMMLSYFAIGQPTSAPPTPTELSGDVISIFSDAYTSSATLSLASFTPPGNLATIVNAASNDVYELTYSGGEFHGFDLSNGLNLGSMENLHYDIWIEGTIQPGAVFNTTLSNHAGGHLTGQTQGYVNTNASFSPGQEGQWLSFDIDLDIFANGSPADPRDIISQIVFTATNLTNTGPVYVDNIYFWKDFVDPNADATLSDLTLDGNTVTGFASSIFTYNVELPNGTTTAPTVAGIATQAGSGSSNVSVTQASGVPGTATLDVTAPNGTDTETYTVNFTEAPALPPAAPTPPPGPALSIISDAYTNIAVPQVDVFGGTLTNFDLNTSGNEEARSLIGGSGFQFNFFPGSAFVDISQATMMHFDFYAEGLADNDVLRIRLLDQSTAFSNIARLELDAVDSGNWISVDLMIPDGTLRNDFDDIDSGGSSIDVTQLALIQFNTLDLGSSLNSKEIFLSNIYFYGGTLSTPDALAQQFKVFPNPTQNVWNIKSNNQIIGNVIVYDILGKEVYTVKPNNTEAIIESDGLSQGLYFAKIKTANGESNIRLVKN
jgi:Secretion system C-terminal sorting domain